MYLFQIGKSVKMHDWKLSARGITIARSAHGGAATMGAGFTVRVFVVSAVSVGLLSAEVPFAVFEVAPLGAVLSVAVVVAGAH